MCVCYEESSRPSPWLPWSQICFLGNKWDLIPENWYPTVPDSREGLSVSVSKHNIGEIIYYLINSLNLFFFTLLLFSYSCLHFLPNTSPPTPAKPPSLPWFHPPPWFCPCVLYSSSWKPFSPLFLPSSPLAIVRLFLTSMSLVIFCLLFSS